jgi:hypothetical protein
VRTDADVARRIAPADLSNTDPGTSALIASALSCLDAAIENWVTRTGNADAGISGGIDRIGRNYVMCLSPECISTHPRYSMPLTPLTEAKCTG